MALHSYTRGRDGWTPALGLVTIDQLRGAHDSIQLSSPSITKGKTTLTNRRAYGSGTIILVKVAVSPAITTIMGEIWKIWISLQLDPIPCRVSRLPLSTPACAAVSDGEIKREQWRKFQPCLLGMRSRLLSIYSYIISPLGAHMNLSLYLTIKETEISVDKRKDLNTKMVRYQQLFFY